MTLEGVRYTPVKELNILNKNVQLFSRSEIVIWNMAIFRQADVVGRLKLYC